MRRSIQDSSALARYAQHKTTARMRMHARTHAQPAPNVMHAWLARSTYYEKWKFCLVSFVFICQYVWKSDFQGHVLRGGTEIADEAQLWYLHV